MSDELPVRIIRPPRGWLSIRWAELWHFRELLYFLTWRDVKVRYKQTVLGVLWAFLQPFVQLVLFSIVFGRIAKMSSDGFPYPVFAYAGILPWQFFAESVNRSSASLLNSSSLLTKVYFPRLIIPLSAVGGCLVDFIVALVIFAGLIVYYGLPVNVGMLLAPLLVLMTLVPALGTGILLSAMTVSFRDFRYIIPFGLQAWFFMTPVVYPVSVVPEKWRFLLMINPMSGVIGAYRSVLLGSPVQWELTLASAVGSVVLLCVGVYVFNRMERYFADLI